MTSNLELILKKEDFLLKKIWLLFLAFNKNARHKIATDDRHFPCHTVCLACCSLQHLELQVKH